MKRIICMLGVVSLLFCGTAQAQNVEVKEKTKKGWSKKAKGAAIGAGAGAATGAIISKNNSKGAIIGGAAGAGAGYIYGRHKDKKKPSIEYKYKRTVKYK